MTPHSGLGRGDLSTLLDRFEKSRDHLDYKPKTFSDSWERLFFLDLQAFQSELIRALEYFSQLHFGSVIPVCSVIEKGV